MIRCRTSVALVIVSGYVLMTAVDARGQKTTPGAFTLNVTSKEIAEDFAKRAVAAQRKFNPPAPKKGKNKGKAVQNKINIDGLVLEVDEKNSTVTLEGFKKVTVLLKAKKISGEKAGKRIAVAKDGVLVEFKDKSQVILEFNEVKLEKFPETK